MLRMSQPPPPTACVESSASQQPPGYDAPTRRAVSRVLSHEPQPTSPTVLQPAHAPSRTPSVPRFLVFHRRRHRRFPISPGRLYVAFFYVASAASGVNSRLRLLYRLNRRRRLVKTSPQPPRRINLDFLSSFFPSYSNLRLRHSQTYSIIPYRTVESVTSMM